MTSLAGAASRRAATPDPRPGSAPRLVAALALCQFVALMDRSLSAVLATPIKASLGLTDTQLGLLQGTGFALLYALAIVPAGLLADRIDRRRLLLTGLGLWSFGILGYGLAPGFPALFCALLLVGLGQAVLLPCALSLIAERVPGTVRARALSSFTAAGILGRTAALIGGGALLGTLAAPPLEPWRIVVLASLALNLLAFSLLLLGADAALPRPGAGRDRDAAMLRAALRWMAGARRRYALLLVLLSATVLAIQGVVAWTPTLLHRRFAIDPGQAALVAGAVTVLAGVAGHAAGGWLGDAAMRRRGLSGLFGVAAVSLALAVPGLVAFAQGEGWFSALAGLALFFATMGAATPTGLALLQAVTGTSARGTVSALVLAAATLIGLGLGPLLVGVASDRSALAGDGLGPAVMRVVLPVLLVGLASAVTGCLAERRRATGRGAA